MRSRVVAVHVVGAVAGVLVVSGCYEGFEDQAGTGTQGSGSSGDVEETDGDGSSPLGCEELDPGTAPVRRLTRDQLVFTIEDVLGVDASVPAQALPEDLREDGFTNTASALVATFAHVQGYRALADEAVDAIPDFGAFMGTYTSCTDFEDACEDDFVAGLGRRLYRRPLSDREIAELRGLFAVAADEGDAFEVGARLALTSMLQAPPFLYRLEGRDDPGADQLRDLDDYELASRLSYLLWSSAPDPALLERADSGELGDDEVLLAEAERMLDDPRSRRVSERYVRDWLALDRLDGAARDADAYPEFTPALAQAMKAETLAVYEAAVWDEPAPLWSLLTREQTIASPAVAELYGLSVSGEGPAEYDLRDVPERIGILTHAGVLTAMSDRDEPSLVERALFVYEDVLCGSVAPPPPGVDQDMRDAEEGSSQRDISEARVADAQCGGCHGQFDALAYSLTQFDAIGAQRAVDERGNLLRSDGVFDDGRSDDPPVPFTDVEQFMVALSGSPAVKTCMAKKNLQFALGRPLESADDCAVERIATRFREGGGTWRELALSIVTDPTFSVVRVD